MFRAVMLVVAILGGAGVFTLFCWISIKDIENSDRMAREARARREARERAKREK